MKGYTPVRGSRAGASEEELQARALGVDDGAVQALNLPQPAEQRMVPSTIDQGKARNPSAEVRPEGCSRPFHDNLKSVFSGMQTIRSLGWVGDDLLHTYPH